MISRRSKFLCALVCAFFAYAKPANTQATDLFISEYIEGSSNNKAIEIYNGTGAAINLATAGYNIQMFFNGNPVATLTINLNGTVAAGDVYVLAQSSADPAILAQADQTNGSGWFNGDDAVVLRKGTAIIDSLGQAGVDPGAEWGSGPTSTADNTLRRKFTVTAGDPNHTDVFDPSLEWEGFANNSFGDLGVFALPPPPPPTPVLEIHEIQGNGAVSPFNGQLVETLDNIVTAKRNNGFFIQAPAHRYDADNATSEGIFVFTSVPPTVNVGDRVDVIGSVQEFFTLTELVGPTVTIDSSGETLPAPVMLGPTLPSPVTPGSLEPLEGMLVRVENAMVTGPTDQFGDTPVVATGTRPFREPGILAPGLPGLPVWDGNPEIFEINSEATFAAGTIIDVAEGPLTFSFGDYQIWPTALTSDLPAAAARPVRARVEGEMTVGSQNMLRLFDTVNDPGTTDAVLTAAVFNSRIAKASLYIREVLGTPDVLVLEEVENLDVANAVASKINADDPAVGYTAQLLEGNDIGGIDIAMLVRSTMRVDSITQLGKTETFMVNGKPAILHDRPPLVLHGAYTGNGAAFPITVIGIHNRSLSDIDDASDGPRVRAKRFAQALSIAGYVQSIQETDPDRRIVLTGDFNAFEFTDGYVDVLGVITGNLDPSGALVPGVDQVNPNLINQVNSVSTADRYSFIFDGSAQVLDHTLTTANLQPFVRGFEYSRGNADVPQTQHTNPLTPVALSDHDGMVLFVMTDKDADGLADDKDSCPASSMTLVTVGTCTTSVPEHLFSNGCSIGDTLAQMAAASENHGAFLSDATHWLTELRRGGVIDNKQRGEIVSCAAKK